MNRKRIIAFLLAAVMLLGMMPAANALEDVTYIYHYDQGDTYSEFSVTGTTVAGFPTADTEWQLPENKAFLGWVSKQMGQDTLYFPGDATPIRYATGDFYAVFVNEPIVAIRNGDDIGISASEVMYPLENSTEAEKTYTGTIPTLTDIRLFYMTGELDETPEELELTNKDVSANEAYTSITETGYYYFELTYEVDGKTGTVVSRPFEFYAKPNLTISAAFADTDMYENEKAYVTVKMTDADGEPLFGQYGDVTFNTDGESTVSVTLEDRTIEITGLPSIKGELSYKAYINDDEYALMQAYDPVNEAQAFIEGTVDPASGVDHTDELTIKKLRSNYSFNVVNDGGDATDSFDVTFSAYTIFQDKLNGQYGDVTFTNGEATVSVQGGETVSITGLPARTTVNAWVAEKDNYSFSATLNGEEASYTGSSGYTSDYIFRDDTAKMVLTAAYAESYHSLELYTYGSDAEEGDEFTYTITLKDRGGNPITSIATETYEVYGESGSSTTYQAENGVYKIEAPLNQYLKIVNLAYNTAYKVELKGLVPEGGGDGTFDCTTYIVGEPEGNLTEDVNLSYTPDYTGNMVYLTCYEMVETEDWPSGDRFRVGRVIQLPQAINYYPQQQKLIGWRVQGDTDGKIYLLNEPYTVTTEYSTTLEPVWEEMLHLNIYLEGMGEFVPEDADFTVEAKLFNEGTNTPVTGTFYDDDGNAIVFDAEGKASFTMRQKYSWGTNKYIYDLPTRTRFIITMTAPDAVEPEKYTATSDTTVTGEIISSGDNNGIAEHGYAYFSFSYYTEFDVAFNPDNGDEAATQHVTTDFAYVTTPAADTLTAPAGKVFDGWQAEDGSIYASNVSVPVTGATSFTALWRETAGGGYTVTIKPGYTIGEDDERTEVSGTTYTFPEEGDEPLFMGALFEGMVQVAGETGSENALYTYTAPEDTGLMHWEYITYRDGVEIARGGCGSSITVTVQGDMEIYPVYNTKIDIALDYVQDGIEDGVITGHVKGSVLSVLDNYHHDGVVNDQVHTGWYIDKDQNGVYEYWTSDMLLWDFDSDSNISYTIGTAELEGTVNNNTITALWADVFTIVYRDYDADGNVIAEQIDLYRADQYYDGAYVSLRDSYPEEWTPSGEFAGWTTDGVERIYSIAYEEGTSEYIVNALWGEETPEYVEFALQITDTKGKSFTGLPVDTTNTVSVSKNEADEYTLTAGVEYGQIPAKDESGTPYSYKWNVMPMENGDGIPEYDEEDNPVGALSAVITEESITGETLLHLFEQEYSQYRLLLCLYDPDDENNIVGGIDNTRYMAYVDVTFTEDTMPTISITMEGAELVNGEATVSQDKLSGIVLTAEQIGYADQNSYPAMWYWDIYDADTGDSLASSNWGQQTGDMENTPITLSLRDYLYYISSASKLKIVARTTNPYTDPATELASAEVLINVTEPDLGSVVLKIAIDSESYIGVTNDVLNLSTGYIYARYEASGIESSYNPYWTLVPVDENGDALTDEYGDEIGAIWTSEDGNWTDYICTVYDLRARAQESNYQYVRLTLSMKNAQTGAVYNPDNSKGYMASRVLYFEPEEPTLSVSLQVLVDGEDVGFDNAVSKKADAQITVVVENAPEDAAYTYGWEIIGQNNGYDNGFDYPSDDEAHANFWLNQDDRPESDRNMVSLKDDLLFMDAEETVWYINVIVKDAVGSSVGSGTGYLKINLYDYSAAITAADAEGNAIEDISSAELTHESDVTFTAALAPDYNGEASDVSWVWTAEANGKTHTLEATDADVTLKDVAALDQYATSWKLKAYAQNSDGRLSSEAEVNFSYPYVGGFTLFIDASNVDGNYNYTGTSGNTGTFGDSLDSYIHLRPAWIGEPEDGMDTYSPVWSASPLDAEGQPIEGVSFDNLYVEFYGWDYDWDYGDLYGGAIRDADANKEYVENTQWRVTLKLVHNGDSSVADTVAVDMHVPIRYEAKVVGQSGEETYDMDSFADAAFTPNQTLVLTPSIVPATEEEVSWLWHVRGGEYNEDEYAYEIEESIGGETLTLNQLIALDLDTTSWYVRAEARKDDNRIAESDWIPINITYDYTAAITVTMNGDTVEDLASETVYADSNVSFTAAIDPDYDGEITWNWLAEKKIRDYYGSHYTAYKLDATGDTISLADVVACDPYATDWRVRAYATADGKKISEDGVVDDFDLSYAGDFYVAIVKQDVWENAGEDVYFTGISGNTDLNPHFKSGYHAKFYGTPDEFGDENGGFYPRWTASALDANGDVLYVDGQEMTFQILHSVNDNQTGDDMWNGWIYNDEIGDIFNQYGFGLYGDDDNFHPYWRLTLSIDNDGSTWEVDTGEEYDPNHEYRASVDIKLGMPIYTGIYGNNKLGYVSRDKSGSTYTLAADECLYQARNYDDNIDEGDYTLPLWTVQPIVNGSVTGDARQVTVHMTDWDTIDEYEDYGYGGCISLSDIQGAYADNEYAECRSWRVTLQVADESGTPLAKEDNLNWDARTVVDVQFEEPEPEEIVYELILTDAATNEEYSSNASTSHTIYLDSENRQLTLNATMQYDEDGNKVTVEDAVISWAWVGTDAEGNNFQNTQGEMTTGATYIFDELLAQANDAGMTISATGYLFGEDDTIIAATESINISVSFGEAPNPDDPIDPEASGVKFFIGEDEYEHEEVISVTSGLWLTIRAEGFGAAENWPITYAVNGTVVENATVDGFEMQYTEIGTYTITATAKSETAAYSMRNDDGSYTGTLYIAVSGETENGNSALVDPSAADYQPTEFDVTGILKSNETVNEATIYSVEITWGAMAFQYATTTTTTRNWDAINHTWSENTKTSAGEWKLISEERLNLVDGAKAIFPDADQSYVVVFNHSNAAVDVAMANTAETNNYDVTSVLNEVSGGVDATSASSSNHTYTLARGIEGTVYDKTTGTAAQIELAGVPADGISEDASDPSMVAKLTVIFSKAD